MKASVKSAKHEAMMLNKRPPSCAVEHTKAAARSSTVSVPSLERTRLRRLSMPSANLSINPTGVKVMSLGWPKSSSVSRIESTLHAVANSSSSKS